MDNISERISKIQEAQEAMKTVTPQQIEQEQKLEQTAQLIRALNNHTRQAQELKAVPEQVESKLNKHSHSLEQLLVQFAEVIEAKQQHSAAAIVARISDQTRTGRNLQLVQLVVVMLGFMVLIYLC